uniref:C2H2-type domain-containing protein n=1 Tax=Tetranychus urticae TaxID=32264 RepID=T1K358_TETUR
MDSIVPNKKSGHGAKPYRSHRSARKSTSGTRLVSSTPTYDKISIAGRMTFQCRYFDCKYISTQFTQLIVHQTVTHGLTECEKCSVAYFSKSEKDNCFAKHESLELAESTITEEESTVDHEGDLQLVIDGILEAEDENILKLAPYQPPPSDSPQSTVSSLPSTSQSSGNFVHQQPEQPELSPIKLQISFKRFKCQHADCGRSFENEWALKSHFCAMKNYKIPRIIRLDSLPKMNTNSTQKREKSKKVKSDEYVDVCSTASSSDAYAFITKTNKEAFNTEGKKSFAKGRHLSVTTSRVQAELVARRHYVIPENQPPQIITEASNETPTTPPKIPSPFQHHPSSLRPVQLQVRVQVQVQVPVRVPVQVRVQVQAAVQMPNKTETETEGDNQINNRPRVCPVCHRVFKSRAAARAHFRFIHPSLMAPKNFALASAEQIDSRNTNIIINTSGHFTCEVCNVRRWRKRIMPKYGALACAPCEQFFASFLTKPAVYFCESKGECLDGNDVPKDQVSQFGGKQKCKACWIKLCFERFQKIDVWRNQIRKKFYPRLRSTGEHMPGYDYDYIRVYTTVASLSYVKTKTSKNEVDFDNDVCKICCQIATGVRCKTIYGTSLCSKCEASIKRFIRTPKVVYCQNNFSCLPKTPFHSIVPVVNICKACKIKRWLNSITIPDEINQMLSKYKPMLYPYSSSDNEEDETKKDK